MENRRYYWLKLKENFFNDKKIKKLRTIAGGDTYTIIYLKLQLLSLKDEGNLYFDNVEDTFIEELALEIDEQVEDVKVCIMYLIKTGLIQEVSETEYSLPETKRCIGSETASTIRSRICRENQKMLQCNNNATKCNVEIDIEKDIDIDINNKKETKRNFIKPTIEEIKKYCQERNNGINANTFYDFYESKNWYVGKNKMKDWKACIRTWEQRNNNTPDWVNKKIEIEKATPEEIQELDNLINEVK